MGFSEVVCTYIYGTFELIVGAIEALQEMGKAMLDRIESLAQALLTLWNFTIEKLVVFAIDVVKTYEKKLVDMIYNASKSEFWCSKLWDCLSFVSALLDPSSLLFKQLDRWYSDQCKPFVNADLLDTVRSMLSDFQTFQQTICSYGFSFEFGISIIKDILNSLKRNLLVNQEACMKSIKQIKNLCQSYLNWTIDTGIIDYLAKIEALVNCIIDDSETCASIATASNYYQNACSVMHIEKDGDTWSMTSEYKNQVYGTMEGNTIRIKNAMLDIDALCESIVNPDELKRANNAFNLSKNIFPGGITWDDMKNENGNFDIRMLGKKKTWRKNTMYQKYNQSVDELMKAWRHGRDETGNASQVIKDLNLSGTENLNEFEIEQLKADYADISIEDLMKNVLIDPEGNVFYRYGCNIQQIYPTKLYEPIVKEYFATESGSNEVLLDKGEILSVTQAAIKINEEPDSDLAKRCEKIWRNLNEWAKNDDTAKKYDSARI